MPVINKLPATAGKIKLISHMPAVVAIMPSLFTLSMPKSCNPTSPRIPKSATGIVGKIANTKNITHTVQVASTIFNCTLNM